MVVSTAKITKMAKTASKNNLKNNNFKKATLITYISYYIIYIYLIIM